MAWAEDRATWATRPERRPSGIEPPMAAPSRPVNFGWAKSRFFHFRVPTLSYGDARQWPLTRWCILPETQHRPRGFDLVIGDLPCRLFPAWY
jgi:hypothetical protein